MSSNGVGVSPATREFTIYEGVGADGSPTGPTLRIGQHKSGEWFTDPGTAPGLTTFATYDEAARDAAQLATGYGEALTLDTHPEADLNDPRDPRWIGNRWRRVGEQFLESLDDARTRVTLRQRGESFTPQVQRITGCGRSLLLDGASWKAVHDGAGSVQLFGEVEILDALSDVYASAREAGRLLRVQVLGGWHYLIECGQGDTFTVEPDPITRWLDHGHSRSVDLDTHLEPFR